MRARVRLIAAAIALLILALTALALLRGLPGLARRTASTRASEPDPMFAEPAEQVTRPPQPEETPVVSAEEDPSQNWVYETLTPVEQTAAELADESF